MHRKHKDKFNSEEFYEALTKMVSLYGEKNWAEVARQLHLIYGYEIENSKAASKWKSINPKIDRIKYDNKTEEDFWKKCLECKGDCLKVKNLFLENNKKYRKEEISLRFICIMKQKLYTIMKVYGQGFEKYLQMINEFKNKTYQKIAQLNFDESKEKDSKYNQVKNSSQLIINICDFMVKLGNINENLIIVKLEDKLSDSNTLIQALEDIKYLDLLTKIRYNSINSKKIIKVQNIDGNVNEYYQEVYSSDSDQYHFPQFYKPQTKKKQIIKQQIEEINEEENTQYSAKEISDIKDSILYKILFEENSKHFYEWYNSAAHIRAQDIQEYSYNIQPQINKVKKKVKVDKNVNESGVVKTVRGKIRTNKKIFNNGMTIKFDYAQEEQEIRQRSDDDEYQQMIHAMEQFQK